MRKIITILALTLANSLFAQLAPGKYSYSNKEARITFAITDDGKTIKDCLIKGTNDISLISLRQFKTAGSGIFVKTNTDTTFTGYYSVEGEMPTYEIKIRKTPEKVSIIIKDVRLNSTTFKIE